MQFFKEEGYIPSKKILIFDLRQLFALLLCFLFSSTVFCIASKLKPQGVLRLARILATANLFSITFRTLNYILQKNFTAKENLPLHICSFNLFFCFFAVWFQNRVLYDFIFAMSPLPALFAILLPEPPAAKYPKFNFRSIEFYFSHTLLIVVPLLVVLYMGFIPSLKYWFWVSVLFISAMFIAGFFNSITGGNYMYINYGPKGTPLETGYNKCGKVLYRILMGVMFVILYLLMHGIYKLF